MRVRRSAGALVGRGARVHRRLTMAEAHMRPEISVVIPCWNETENARAIHAAVVNEITPHAASYEILFIDNGSTDGTRDILRDLCAAHAHTRAILNTRNFGQMRSPTYAIYQAEGAAVIAMSADFQDPPALIGALIAQWRAGAQVVLGQRRRERAPWAIRVSRRIGYALLGRFADYPVIPGATGFGLFDRACVDALAAWNEPEPFFRGMVVESGFRIAIVPFDRPERAAGRSKNTLSTLFDFAVSGLAGSSKALLRLPLILSVALLPLAILLMVAAWVTAMVGGDWTMPLLAGFVVTLFGAVFLFLGLIGEQVRAIGERTRGVPLVIEAERVGFPAERQQPSSRTAVRSSS